MNNDYLSGIGLPGGVKKTLDDLLDVDINDTEFDDFLNHGTPPTNTDSSDGLDDYIEVGD